MPLNFKIIGKKIKIRRETLGITQEMVANYLDVNPSHISNIECGRATPSLTALIKIANFLQCSIDNFINEEYTYIAKSKNPTIDDEILTKLQYCDIEKKERILKILDLL